MAIERPPAQSLAAGCRELAEAAAAANALDMAAWLRPRADGRTARQALAEAAALAWDIDRRIAALSAPDGETPPAPPARRADRDRRPVKALMRETEECLARAARRLDDLPAGRTLPHGLDGEVDRLRTLLPGQD